MKEKEIRVDYKAHEVILYAEKEDHSYAPVQTGASLTAQYLDDFFLKKQNLERELKEEMKKGAISPVYYYMLMQDIGIGDLAKRIGISKRKLRKHFRPEVFAKLDEGMLEKYAVVFGIQVEDVKGIK